LFLLLIEENIFFVLPDVVSSSASSLFFLLLIEENIFSGLTRFF